MKLTLFPKNPKTFTVLITAFILSLTAWALTASPPPSYFSPTQIFNNVYDSTNTALHVSGVGNGFHGTVASPDIVGGSNAGAAQVLDVDSTGNAIIRYQSSGVTPSDGMANGITEPAITGAGNFIQYLVYPFVFNGVGWDRARVQVSNTCSGIVATGPTCTLAVGELAPTKFAFEATSSGSPTGCSIQSEYSLDNANWIIEGTSQTCTSPVMWTVIDVPAANVRVNLTALTGGTSPQVKVTYYGTH